MQKTIIGNSVNLFKNITIFLFIFSMFNDVYLVDTIHASILKVIFVLFLVVNIKDISVTFFRKKDNIIYSFNIFIIALVIQTFIQYIIFGNVDIILFILYIVILSVIFYFFTYFKNLDLIVYFIWISILFSIFLCFFVDTMPIRKSGGTLDPNHFSIEVILFLFLSLYLYSKNNSIIFLIVSIIFFIFGILFAMSKASIVVIVIMLIYLFFIKVKSFKPLSILKGFLLIFLMSLIAWNTTFPFLEKIDQFLERTNRNTADARFHSFKAGKSMIENNFIIGVGFYEFKNNKKNYVRGHVQGAAAGAHNVYIKLLAESGIFVFMIYIIFLFLLLIKHYLHIIKSYYIWIHFSVFSYMIMGMTLSLTYEKDVWLMYALLANINYLLDEKTLLELMKKQDMI